MKSVFIKKMHAPSETINTFIEQASDFEFTPEKGEGIRINTQNAHHISCHYLFENIYSQESYNYETNEFEKMTFKRVDVVPFFIDIDLGTLDIIGNKQNVMKIVEYLGKITKYRVAIDNIQINLLDLLENCKKNGVVFVISKVKLSNYIFFDRITGECILNLYDYPNPVELLKKFENQIVYVSLSITTDDTSSIMFYKSGSISIYKDMDNIDIEFLRLLKQGI